MFGCSPGRDVVLACVTAPAGCTNGIVSTDQDRNSLNWI